MNRARILRARQRERAFTSPQDVRHAIDRIGYRFHRRIGLEIAMANGLVRDGFWVTPENVLDLRNRWRAHMRTVDTLLRENSHRAAWWDVALGALLRCAQLCREAGRLRQEVRP